MQTDSKAVDTLHDFLKRVELFDLSGETVLFRGQPVEGNLLPTIARKNPKQNTTDKEKLLLQQLRLQGATLLNGAGTDLELLITAQHFGLHTRLLDWTTNPLVALWFACESTNSEDAYVYALQADDFISVVADPFKPGKTRVIQPPMNNARIVAQHGWFTLHNFSNKVEAFVPLERNPETKKKMHEYKIEGEKKSTILASLDRIGVSAKTIFPDFPGLCSYFNWRYRDYDVGL